MVSQGEDSMLRFGVVYRADFGNVVLVVVKLPYDAVELGGNLKFLFESVQCLLLGESVHQDSHLYGSFVGLDFAYLVELSHPCSGLNEPLIDLDFGDTWRNC
jgi:hypothetical protein